MELASVTQTSDNSGKKKAVILPPDNRLKDKIGRMKLDALIQPEQVTKAQTAADKSSDMFFIQMEKALDEIEAAFNAMQQIENPSPYLHSIGELAFDIKSDAGTFGVKIASDIAGLLVQYAESAKSPDLSVLAAHINALKSICSHNIRGDGGSVGKELLDSLRKIATKSK